MVSFIFTHWKRENNQKFGLLEALLRIGEWRSFKKICDKLPQTFIVSQYPIAYNLCQLIHLLIDPIYRRCVILYYFYFSCFQVNVNNIIFLHNYRYYESTYNLSNTEPKFVSNQFAPKQVTSFLELRDVIFPMLYTIGSYLSYDPELVYKIIRLLKLALVQVKFSVIKNCLALMTLIILFNT